MEIKYIVQAVCGCGWEGIKREALLNDADARQKTLSEAAKELQTHAVEKGHTDIELVSELSS